MAVALVEAPFQEQEHDQVLSLDEQFRLAVKAALACSISVYNAGESYDAFDLLLTQDRVPMTEQQRGEASLYAVGLEAHIATRREQFLTDYRDWWYFNRRRLSPDQRERFHACAQEAIGGLAAFMELGRPDFENEPVYPDKAVFGDKSHRFRNAAAAILKSLTFHGRRTEVTETNQVAEINETEKRIENASPDADVVSSAALEILHATPDKQSEHLLQVHISDMDSVNINTATGYDQRGVVTQLHSSASSVEPESYGQHSWLDEKILAASVKVSNIPRRIIKKIKAPDDFSSGEKIMWYGSGTFAVTSIFSLLTTAYLESRGINILPCVHGAPCDIANQHIHSALQTNIPLTPAENIHQHHFVEQSNPQFTAQSLPQIPAKSIRPGESEWAALQQAGVKPNKIMGVLNSAAEHSGKPFRWIGKGLKRFLQVNGSTDTESVLDDLGFISH